MPVSERAKQFMPFAAVKGLAEALAAKEQTGCCDREMTEDMAAELNWQLCAARPGQILTVFCYREGAWLQHTGALVRIDRPSRTLQLEGARISFADIREIRLE